MKVNPEKLKTEVWEALKKIPDPEINISIVDLGLVYDVNVSEKGEVKVTMTLTSIGCPLFSLISEPVKQAVLDIKGVKTVDIELTFEPPWTIEKMAPEAKVQLGMI